MEISSGATLSFFSPLADETPDPSAGAIFLPGGYPELHAALLSTRQKFMSSLTAAMTRNCWIYGECGGFMVLGKTLTDKDGVTHPMAGLLDRSRVPSADKDIGLLLRQAMDKVAFLPFGLLVDRWRWGVFDGSITPANYNEAWTDMRLRYQGIVPPVERTEANFDPAAKYHIPGNTPYTRYFLARILQFQFYKAACEQAGWTGPLHRCSVYDQKGAGRKFNAMLEMGASKPWPDALEAFTGTREMSGDALIEYFRPLQAWLEERNEGRRCGWTA